MKKNKIKIYKLKNNKKQSIMKKQKRFIQLFRFKQDFNLFKLKIKNKLKTKKKTFLSFYLTLSNPKLIKIQNNELYQNWVFSKELNKTTLKNVIKIKENVNFYQEKSLIKISPVFYSLKKEISLLKWNNLRQFVLFISEFFYSLQENSKLLLTETIQLNYNIVAQKNIEQIYFANILKQTLNQLFLKKKNIISYRNKDVYFNTITFNQFQKLLIISYFIILINKINNKYVKLNIKKNILNFTDISFLKHLNKWEKTSVAKILFLNNYILFSEEIEKKREKINALYRRRSSNLSKSHLLIALKSISILEEEELILKLKNYLWKQKNNIEIINDSLEQDKLIHLRNKKLRKSRKKTSLQLLYILSRIESKLENIEDIETKNKLINLKNFLIVMLNEKQKRVSSNNIIYTTKERLKNIRKQSIISILENNLNDKNYINTQLTSKHKYQRFIEKITTKLTKTNIKNNKLKIKNKKKIIKSFFNHENITLRRKIRNITNTLKLKKWKNKIKSKIIKQNNKKKLLINKARNYFLNINIKENDKKLKEWLYHVINWEEYIMWQMDTLREKLKIRGLKETLHNTMIWKKHYINIRKLRRQAREDALKRRWQNKKYQNSKEINKKQLITVKNKKQKRKKYNLLKWNSFALKNNFKTRYNRYLWLYGYYRYSYFNKIGNQPFNNKIQQEQNNKKLKNSVIKTQYIKTFKKAKGEFKNNFIRKLLKKTKIKLKKKKKRLFRWNLSKNIYLKCKIWNSSWRKKKARVRRTWINIQPIIKGKYTTYTQKKLLLTAWAGFPLNLFMINTLALTKLSFKLDRLKTKHNNPNKIISKIDREYINRYKYVAIYIKDLVRIGLISMFFKKPSFLAKFTAFQLAKLPRNRKETVFIRFLMKAIRTFSAGRKEIIALRMKFKGRVNRWRRTKFIMRTRGTLPLQTITERIEHGSAQAINRKGAVGIHIWIRYKPSFLLKMHDHILSYMKYSSGLKNIRKKKIKNIKI
jgi:hypothetical protein